MPYAWHSAKTPFAECHGPALDKIFFCFFCYWPPIFFCAALLKHQELLVTIWGFFCGFLLYLVTLFRLIEFFWKLEI